MNATQIVIGFSGLVVPLFLWRVGTRRSRVPKVRVRAVSLTGRVLFNAALVVAVQWVVIAHRHGPWLLLAVLGVPALIASYTLTKALTVTACEPARRRGGARR